jgi:hypothetical protein
LTWRGASRRTCSRRGRAASGERVVAGRTSGLLELGDEVTWEGRHFAVRQRLTSAITRYERPRFFQDRMVRGAFESMEHDHLFEARADGSTDMVDVVRFAAPLGLVGWVAERVVLARHCGGCSKSGGWCSGGWRSPRGGGGTAERGALEGERVADPGRAAGPQREPNTGW